MRGAFLFSLFLCALRWSLATFLILRKFNPLGVKLKITVLTRHAVASAIESPPEWQYWRVRGWRGRTIRQPGQIREEAAVTNTVRVASQPHPEFSLVFRLSRNQRKNRFLQCRVRNPVLLAHCRECLRAALSGARSSLKSLYPRAMVR